jgi:GTP cyclohydrolase II
MHVTLAFAQSLDGSIAARPGMRTALSGSAALAYTHALRARHAAILVGLGTVRADNPRLTVRFAEGPNPQPIVLDSALQLPLDCALLADPARPPWLICRDDAPAARERSLRARGARVLRIAWPDPRSARWPHVLAALRDTGIESLMVEGGAAVIASLLASGCADRISITLAPRLLGGLRALDGSGAAALPVLREVSYQQLGDDLVVEAALEPLHKAEAGA